MAALGHGGRGADQFGTLLACADLLLHDHLPDSDALDGWTAKLSRALLAEENDDAPDWAQCVQWLVSSSAELWRGGGQETVGHYVRRAGGLDGALEPHELDDALAALDKVGLRVTTLDGVQYLAVPNSHRQTMALFGDSHWRGMSGATPAYVRALRRAPGAVPSRTALRVGGASCRCTLVPLATLFDDGGPGIGAARPDPDPEDRF